MTHIVVNIVVAILALGFVFWLVQQLPIDATFVRIAKGVALAFVVLWIIGLLIPDLGIPRFG